jgi:hypothetical protein
MKVNSRTNQRGAPGRDATASLLQAGGDIPGQSTNRGVSGGPTRVAVMQPTDEG